MWSNNLSHWNLDFDVTDILSSPRFCGTVQSVADLLANPGEGRIGDVVYAVDTGLCYINDGESYVEIGGTGADYSELPSVTNCPNCGAPLSSHHCEYCGSYID